MRAPWNCMRVCNRRFIFRRFFVQQLRSQFNDVNYLLGVFNVVFFFVFVPYYLCMCRNSLFNEKLLSVFVHSSQLQLVMFENAVWSVEHTHTKCTENEEKKNHSYINICVHLVAVFFSLSALAPRAHFFSFIGFKLRTIRNERRIFEVKQINKSDLNLMYIKHNRLCVFFSLFFLFSLRLSLPGKSQTRMHTYTQTHGPND